MIYMPYFFCNFAYLILLSKEVLSAQLHKVNSRIGDTYSTASYV